MARRLTEIDELLAGDHYWLRGGERVYFLREYTSERGYSYSETNSVINNLKKSPTLRGTPQWRYKLEAIRQVAGELVPAINPTWLQQATLVPIPPSKTEEHPEYDDRMLQVCRAMDRVSEHHLDMRPLLRQRHSVEAAHAGGLRMTPDELETLLEVEEELVKPQPRRFVIVDDVVTTGAHLLAAKRVLAARFGALPAVGLCVARRVFPEEE